MGADGGTIPKRCELVKKRTKKEKLDKHVKNATKWRNCQLTQSTLKKPIIACRFGKLYNKKDVIEAILTKQIAKSLSASHIKGTKDFVELKLTENKDFKGDDAKGDEYNDVNQTPYLCPVTGTPMNGNHNFVVNWQCGCVFSEKALVEVKTDRCHGCNGPWDAEKSVQLYPEEEKLAEYERKLLAERAEKKAKKELKTTNGEPANDVAALEAAEKKKKREEIKKELLGKDGKKAEKRKATTSDIQSDPTKTEAYKRLFTTCEEAKNKPEGNWVTYNPLYY
ncbi:unnamed protein product [Caenorhabditis auriculariae]|uniref:Replication termination factor 2 n=1 Tax=Caenorhabditis auriculariae TaxID=2777116 RepID=A0A8S1GS65_9PELO|nr:unnamed protein product [Caenorhabditis auriculariae]